MKKYALIILVTILALGSLVGCTQKTPEEAEEPVQEEAAKPIRLGVSLYDRDQFFASQEEAMRKAAEELGGVEITVFNSEYDVQKQLEHMSTFSTQKYDVIATSLVNPGTVAEIIATAGDIPIIFQNRMPDTSEFVAGKHTYIGSDEIESGKLQGEWLANYFKDSGKTVLNVVFLKGDLGLDNTTKRTASAKEALEKAGYTLNIVYEDTAMWSRAEAMTKMEQVLGMGKDIDAVIANNDEMALGAIEALKAVGMLEGIPVVGIDATGSGCAAVKSGEMAMTVFQNAKAQGQKAVEVAKIAASGKPIETFYWIPFEAVTIENVDQYMDN